MGLINWENVDVEDWFEKNKDKMGDALKGVGKATYENFKKIADSLESMAGETFQQTCKSIGGTVEKGDKWECDVNGTKFYGKAIEKLTDNDDSAESSESSDGIVTNVSIG